MGLAEHAFRLCVFSSQDRNPTNFTEYRVLGRPRRRSDAFCRAILPNLAQGHRDEGRERESEGRARGVRGEGEGRAR